MEYTNTYSDRNGYQFTPTQDWFSFNVETFRSLFPLVASAAPRVLEIGSWEGRSAVFLLNELCGNKGQITCIDHFDLMHTNPGRERFRKVNHNLSLTGKSFRVLDQFSFPALMTLLREQMSSTDPGFDWVYVDGSHEADDTLLDGELAWRLARKGAIFIFDDYHWDKEPEDNIHHPRRGIDSFLAVHSGEYQQLSSPTQYQMILQKSSDMRIGFLEKNEPTDGHEAFGYGINIAITIDSSYAMAAAVAIRSIIQHTSGRITIYVVDCGLTEENKLNLRVSAAKNADTTIMFLDLPEDSLAAEMGSTWAKIDMIKVLPVEHVLYLDGDILVRRNLKELWDTDLRGRAVAAAPDVGHPMGHEGVGRGRYFNAGVVIFDLSKIRMELKTLDVLAKTMRDAKWQDQALLNTKFRDDWTELSLSWNAQGLGTYADSPSSDRQSLDLGAMNDTGIVHFTGPVHPDLPRVLNPWVQPYTAKPWGYAGAPGHPFAEEWWTMLENTPWKGYRDSEAYKAVCEREEENAFESAKGKCKKKVREARGF